MQYVIFFPGIAAQKVVLLINSLIDELIERTKF